MNPSEAKRWMDYAKSDLDAAHTLLNSGGFFPRQICLMAQQAGEKALKAILIYLEIPFPYTHDLDRIRELIPEGWEVKGKFPQLYDLSVWAVESRYLVTRLMWLNMKRARLFIWQKQFSMRSKKSWKNDFDNNISNHCL